jgi:hypothetical protein
MPKASDGHRQGHTERHDARETKGSFKTTEFWLTLAGIAALIVVYNLASDASFDLWRTCLLSVVLGAAYVLSRGIAKSGSQDARWDRHELP